MVIRLRRTTAADAGAADAATSVQTLAVLLQAGAVPVVAWRHLAETPIPTENEFESYAAVVILVHAATSEGEPDVNAIARTMTALGWKHQNDAPVTRTDVHPVWNDLWTTLGNIGERAMGEHRSSRVLSGPARILANEALFEESGREDTDFGP